MATLGYIKREDVLIHKRKMSGADFGGEFWDEAVLCEDIRKIPSADVAEVKHGYWIPHATMEKHPYARNHDCSRCGYSPIEVLNYCPNCGAKMDGKRE